MPSANNSKKLSKLLVKYEAGTATASEKAFVESYYLQFDRLPSVMEGMSEAEKEDTRLRLLNRVNESIERVAPVIPIRKRLVRWVAAAAVLVAVSGGGYFILHNKQAKDTTHGIYGYHNDVQPGKKGARLKLGDGRVLELDSLANGLIAMEGRTGVYKKDNEIFYKMVDANGNESQVAETQMIYNELIADIKQRSSATLPDGSIAWVNAASSVRYPVRFAGNERKVTMTGEAIFRVTHNEKQPFRVYVGNHVFEDIGTEFNVHAYADENTVSTTVLEGSVKIGNQLVKANQQAQVRKDGTVQLRTQINTDEIVAWRDGQFTYANAGIEEIMKDAARWYGVEIVFKDKIDEKFGFVGIDRNMPLSNLLHNLETNGGVHFEIEGKKVIVKK